MRVTRFTSFAASASIFMTRVVIGTDIAVSSSGTGDGGDGDGSVRHDEPPFRGAVDEVVVMRLVEHDEKYVTTGALKHATSALDEVKKAGFHDASVHAKSIGTAAAAAVAVTHLIHPRDSVPVTTITQPCSSNNTTPLATQQMLRLSPSLSPASTSKVIMMATPATVNATNITLFAAEAATTICTPISWTNTNAFTTDAACPAPYENGTYCGFVNPEDPCAKQPGGTFHSELIQTMKMLGLDISYHPRSRLTHPCSSLGNPGDGPRVDPDTPEAFLAHAPFHDAALRTATPPGYRLTFVDLYAAANAPPAYDAKYRNLSASAEPPPCYMGYHLLPAYDPAACAALCESDPSGACAAFNLYVERDPAWNPWRCSCDRPRGVTNYKCALFSGTEAVEDAGRATNYGQYVEGGRGFVRKIAGSNGYVRIGAAGRKGGACWARTTMTPVATAVAMPGSGSSAQPSSAGELEATPPSTVGGGTESLPFTPVGDGPFSSTPPGPTSTRGGGGGGGSSASASSAIPSATPPASSTPVPATGPPQLLETSCSVCSSLGVFLILWLL
ncbi:hypothetical protein PG985_014168 [Apiospora marii]|uniref:Uncharacterized protein n=1 Tax=Apiospora marii TaxID=335849 RepID=A0ABR1R5P3_9PEZI